MDTYYFWFAVANLFLAVATANLFLSQVPLPVNIEEWAVGLSLGLYVVCLTVSTHRYLGYLRYRFERILWLSIGLMAVHLYVVDGTQFIFHLSLWQLPILALGFYNIGMFAFKFVDDKKAEHLAIVLSSFVAILLGMHDLLLQFGKLDPGYHAHIAHYGSPVIMLAYAWGLVIKFVNAMNRVENFNQELETLVSLKTHELEHSHSKLRHLETQKVIAEERERIMRELHDGMGSQLVTTLAMVEEGKYSSSEISNAIHQSLDEMRMTIDSLDPELETISDILANLRARITRTLKRANLTVDWRVGELPIMPTLTPEKALHVLRIVQEAMTNVIKHAKASQLAVITGTQSCNGISGVYVIVEDDGCGICETDGQSGRGIANMRARAVSMDGKLSVYSENGTSVTLWVPCVESS